jgi:hypothetical protein
MEDAPIHNQRAHEWMKTVLLTAKGNEYSGADVGDFSERSHLVFVYKFKVNEAIKMCHVPADQHGYVARRFLKGKIENHVLLVAAKSPDKVLTKGDIFDIVDAGIQGTTPGLITRGDKFVEASAVLIGLDIERKTGKAPEMSHVLHEIKTTTQPGTICPSLTCFPDFSGTCTYSGATTNSSGRSVRKPGNVSRIL